MAIDIYKVIPLTAIQQPFVNKDTAEPLALGYLYFYKDTDRTVFKDIYKFSGTPEVPAFTALANPLQLGIAGTPVDPDNGNDLLIYGYPYDDAGDPELYFVQVYSALSTDPEAVLQLTRESYPEPIAPADTPAEIDFINNLIPNGQFVTYEQPANSGILTDDVTPLAMGGWTFILPTGFTSTNTITFESNIEPATSPEANPQQILRFTCTNPNPAEAQKDLTLIFPDVNYLNDKSCTLQFECKAIGSQFNLQVVEGRFYGTDADPYEESVIETFTITTTAYNKYNINFTFNSNAGKVVTADSELRLIFRFPSDVSTDGRLINFILAEGTFSTMIYPDVSRYQAVSQAIAGSIKLPDTEAPFSTGQFLQYGLDESTITPRLSLVPAYPVPTGAIIDFGTTAAPTGFLAMINQSLDLTSANPSATDYDTLFNAIGTNYGYGVDGFIAEKTSSATVRHEAFYFGTATAPNAGTSGFTITVPQVGDSTNAQIVQVVTTLGSSVTAGAWYKIYAPSGRSTVYWFSVNGAGSAPSSPGSLIKKISITSVMTADQVAQTIVDNAICQFQLAKPGYFRRALDSGSGNDPDAADRLNSSGTRTIGDVVGSYEEDAFQDHDHADPGATFWINDNVSNIGGGGTYGHAEIDHTGTTRAGQGYLASTETRPKNYYVLTCIKT